MFDLLQSKTERGHLKTLLDLANADGFLHLSEYELLIVTARKYGLSSNFVHKLRGTSRDYHFKLPKKRAERFHYWFDLISMVLADNIVHEKELSFCEEMAIKFNYPIEIIELTIEKVREGLHYEEVFQSFSAQKIIP
ncbi:MAG: hypothetical protein SFU27_01915 [Thermonemataceae bacterium]|nr:hypothetical protein [Thermonemataceae bacterium]